MYEGPARVSPPRARAVMLVQIVDLDEEEARRLSARLRDCDGVLYADIDAASGLTEVEYRSPCTALQVLAILRSAGRPVLTDLACC